MWRDGTMIILSALNFAINDFLGQKRKMEHFQERFSKFENVENLFNFYKKTIKRLCENFFGEKLVMIFCAAKDGTCEAVDDDSTKKKCRYHKLFQN